MLMGSDFILDSVGSFIMGNNMARLASQGNRCQCVKWRTRLICYGCCSDKKVHNSEPKV